MGPTRDKVLIAEFCTAFLKIDKSDSSGYNSGNKHRQPSLVRLSHLTLLDFRFLVLCCLYSELQIDKSDLSLCNQAEQNSEINILSQVSPLTVPMRL